MTDTPVVPEAETGRLDLDFALEWYRRWLAARERS
jgi:hypothetical protein